MQETNVATTLKKNAKQIRLRQCGGTCTCKIFRKCPRYKKFNVHDNFLAARGIQSKREMALVLGSSDTQRILVCIIIWMPVMLHVYINLLKPLQVNIFSSDI